MLIRDVVMISLNSLLRNKARAVLTMLGIVIGIASVILMLAVGNAAQDFIMSQVASFGSDLLFVRSGQGDGKQLGPPTVTKQVITVKDFKKLKEQSWVRSVDADVFTSGVVDYESESLRAQIEGTSETGASIFSVDLEQGSYFTSDDVDSKSKVAVLGHDIAQDLFGAENPLGKSIKIQKQNYRVIGVLQTAGTRFFTNLDRQIYVPFSTLMTQLNMEKLQFMSVKTGTVATNEAKERIRIILRESHRIDNPTGDLSKDDFFIASQEDTAERAGMIGTILSVLLSSIASISLVVGGVGIMNIMYVTVTERTREIGLRKAIGARGQDILRQFLYEAIFLSVCAGILGIIVGMGFSWLGLQALAAYQKGWSFNMPWSGAALGFGVSVAIGIVFGYFPARKAAKLNPIEALRYE